MGNLGTKTDDYREIEVVGPAAEVASFRMHMRDLVEFIVEETPLRIRFVADRSEVTFLNSFPNVRRITPEGKVFIFLKAADINGNLDSLGRSLNN